MEKFKLLQKLKEIYSNGQNIIQYLKSISNDNQNNIEDILISYDIQSGIYIKYFLKDYEIRKKNGESIAKVIETLADFDSLLEVGIGEATTLSPLVKKLIKKPKNLMGFDISWSRLKYAQHFLRDFNIQDVELFTGNLFEAPLLDNSVDIVYTSHTIEPNRGKEEEALKELYRITKKYLILLKPAYEFANENAKQRMKNHGFITNLYGTAKKLGYKIIEYRLFNYQWKPEVNPTGLIVIEKKPKFETQCNLVCPITKTKLLKYNDSFLYSKEGMLAYPILEGIPCLLKENAILATLLLTNYVEFKRENDKHFNYN
jgi:ubiquinone/menaquinone biosynthesis C-methylase UbiE